MLSQYVMITYLDARNGNLCTIVNDVNVVMMM